MLNKDGKAEYLAFSERPDRTSYFTHEPQATWGVRPVSAKATIHTNSPEKPIRVVRDFWLKTSTYRFDYLEGNGQVYEVDKMGIQRTFKKIDNMPH